MARFDRQIALAQRLIKKNGQLVKWRSLPDPVTDPLKPWEGGTVVPVEHDVWICFVPVQTREDVKEFTYLSETEVQIGLTYGLMGNVPFEPTARDVVIRDGRELRMNWLDLLSPNGQKILWTAEFLK